MERINEQRSSLKIKHKLKLTNLIEYIFLKNTPLPTISEIDAKYKEIQSFNDYRFNDDDIDFIVKEKKRFTKGNDNIAEKKIELLKEREEAEQGHDLERVKEIDLVINDLNEKASDLNIKRSGNFNLLA